MIMHTSTLPSIQQQLDSVQPRLLADTVQLTDQLIENNRLIREDVSPLLKYLACDSKKNVELVAEILALHRHPNCAGVSQIFEDPSCAGQHIVIARDPNDSLNTGESDKSYSSAIDEPLAAS